jgi:hypothetical protein
MEHVPALCLGEQGMLDDRTVLDEIRGADPEVLREVDRQKDVGVVSETFIAT